MLVAIVSRQIWLTFGNCLASAAIKGYPEMGIIFDRTRKQVQCMSALPYYTETCKLAKFA